MWPYSHLCRDNGSWLTPLPNQPKLHHFLAEAYLRRFADERGDLWLLDRLQGIVPRQPPQVRARSRGCTPSKTIAASEIGASNQPWLISSMVRGDTRSECSTREDA